MNPLGLTLTLAMALGVLALPRRWAALAVMGAVCYNSQNQQFNLGGFHFTAVRFVLLAGIIRSVARGEFRRWEFNAIDKSVGWYILAVSLIYPIGRGTSSALVYQLGCSYNALFPYVVFRCLITNLEDVEIFIGDLALFILPLTFLMMLESLNGHNLFAALGNSSGDEFRNGHYRCAGSFRSPITGGTFGATLMPIFLGMFLANKKRSLALIGLLAASMITVSSRSSGPLLAYICAIIGHIFWKWRGNMQFVRRAIVVILICLQMVMKAPVWYILAKVSDVTGGGGWHRAYLIDQAVHHFGSWWLAGTDDTGDWMPTQLSSGGADLTNEYISAGANGGLLTMMLFIWIIVHCFRHLGRAMQKIRGVIFESEKVMWGLGAAMFATLVNFFSVAYFDQVDVVWYMLVAIISSAAFSVLKADQNVTVESGEPADKLHTLSAEPV